MPSCFVLYSAVIPNSCIRGLLLCSSSERRLYALECPFEQFRPESLRQCINSKVELETRKLSYHSFSVKAVSASSNHWPLRVSFQNRRSVQVQARTDKINNNLLYLRLSLFFCKAVERKVDFRIFCWNTCGLLMRRNSKNFSSAMLAACALGKNRVRWPRFWAFYPYQNISSHPLAR